MSVFPLLSLLPILRLYCPLIQSILAFRTLDVSGFLVFGVPNAKNLAFDTPDGNALIFIPKKCHGF